MSGFFYPIRRPIKRIVLEPKNAFRSRTKDKRLEIIFNAYILIYYESLQNVYFFGDNLHIYSVKLKLIPLKFSVLQFSMGTSHRFKYSIFSLCSRL